MTRRSATSSPPRAPDGHGAPSAEASGERATLVPGFDVALLAQDSNRWRHAALDSGVVVRVEPNEQPSVYARAADLYWARLGAPSSVPRLCAPALEFPVEQRVRGVGFILWRVDGVATIGDILASCDLPELTALCLFCELLDAGVIAFDG